MTQVTWKITNLDRQTSDGFVTTAHWQATATEASNDPENPYSGSIYNTASFEGSPVVSYDSLTEADVLAWVWETVDKATVEAAVLAQIEAQKNPVKASGLPWGE
jgi:hypothetical protein